MPTPQKSNRTIHAYHEGIQNAELTEQVEKDISMPVPELKVEPDQLLSLDNVDASAVQNKLVELKCKVMVHEKSFMSFEYESASNRMMPS